MERTDYEGDTCYRNENFDSQGDRGFYDFTATVTLLRFFGANTVQYYALSCI